MKLKDVRKILAAELTWSAHCSDCGEREVRSCHASDLMSDVLTFRGPGSLLLTGLTNPHVIRTAEVADFVAICFVRGKKPQPAAVQLAKEKGIPLLATPLSMFESCGWLYEKGLRGGDTEEVIPNCRTKR